MPKGIHGGTRGPAPDPMALRRDRDRFKADDFVTLPAAGVNDVAPFPLVKPSAREKTLWSELWQTKPQAHMWLFYGVHVEVAMYVRKLCEAEKPGSTAAAAVLVRQLGDSLGLSITGLRVNKWRIQPEDSPIETPARPRVPSSRDRLRVVPHD